MAGKSTKEWPFKVTVMLCAGHPFGQKKRESSRTTLHRTREDAVKEVQLWRSMDQVVSMFDRVTKLRVEI